jgi:PAS domain S-box-containing protein
MQQPVSFCTACLIAPTRFAKPLVSKNTDTRVRSSCVVSRTVMNYKIDSEERHDDMPILFTLDLAGNFKSVDAAAERTFGYTAENMRRMNIAELVAPTRAAYLQEQIARAAMEDLGAVYEIEVFTKDGRCRPLEISTRLIMRNGCPFELEGIAFPRINIFGGRPRCLDEEFWIGPGLNGLSTLTFLPAR